MEYDISGISSELERFKQDAAFFDEHRDEYHQKWPNQAVAIFNGENVAHADSLDSLMTQLDDLNIPKSRAYVGWAISVEQQTDAENRASSFARSISSNK